MPTQFFTVPFDPCDEWHICGCAAWELQEKLLAKQTSFGVVWPYLAGVAVV